MIENSFDSNKLVSLGDEEGTNTLESIINVQKGGMNVWEMSEEKVTVSLRQKYDNTIVFNKLKSQWIYLKNRFLKQSYGKDVWKKKNMNENRVTNFNEAFHLLCFRYSGRCEDCPPRNQESVKSNVALLLQYDPVWKLLRQRTDILLAVLRFLPLQKSSKCSFHGKTN